MKEIHRALLFVILLIVAVASGSSIAQSSTDSEISAQVRARIQQNFPGIAGNISVDTQNGMVTLGGSVTTPGEATKLEGIVRSISGVRMVHSNLTVRGKSANRTKPRTVRNTSKTAERTVMPAPLQARIQPQAAPAIKNTPSPQTTAPAQPDSVTLALVRAQLLDHGILTRPSTAGGAKAFEDSSLPVVSIESKNGALTISGNVRSKSEATRILQLVQSVNGVTGIISSLRVESAPPVATEQPVKPAPEETEDTHVEQQLIETVPQPQATAEIEETPPATANIPTGGTVNAGSPTIKNPDIKPFPVDEDPVPPGSTGTTSTDEADDTNTDQTQTAPKDTASDLTITNAAKAKLESSGIAGADDIEVRTTDGVVTLSGTVDNQLDVDRALEIVRNVTHVRSVVSKLTIRQEE